MSLNNTLLLEEIKLMDSNLTYIKKIKSTLGEGPLYNHLDNAIYWCDILESKINRYSLNDRKLFTLHLNQYDYRC